MKRLMFPLVAALATATLFVAASPAAADDVTFRDLVRKYVKTGDKKAGEALALNDATSVVALEYKVLHRIGTEEKAVDPNTYHFKIGDQIRVQVAPMNDTYIYIFHEGPTGTRTCLLPNKEEVPPKAKGGDLLELPGDGYFEFSAPPGDEKLIVVASEKVMPDLAALQNVVFKKPGDKLTKEEEEIKKKLNGNVTKVLKNIRDRQTENTTYRGILTEAKAKTVFRDMASAGKTQATIEEPPHDKEESSFAMATGAKGGARPDLFVSIPLKSIAIQKK